MDYSNWLTIYVFCSIIYINKSKYVMDTNKKTRRNDKGFFIKKFINAGRPTEQLTAWSILKKDKLEYEDWIKISNKDIVLLLSNNIYKSIKSKLRNSLSGKEYAYISIRLLDVKLPDDFDPNEDISVYYTEMLDSKQSSTNLVNLLIYLHNSYELFSMGDDLEIKFNDLSEKIEESILESAPSFNDLKLLNERDFFENHKQKELVFNALYKMTLKEAVEFYRMNILRISLANEDLSEFLENCNDDSTYKLYLLFKKYAEEKDEDEDKMDDLLRQATELI